MSDLTRITNAAVAHAQVWLFAVALFGFIGLLYIIMLGAAHLDDTSEKLAYTMLGVLGTIVTQQAGYFYARQRPEQITPPEGDPDANKNSPGV